MSKEEDLIFEALTECNSDFDFSTSKDFVRDGGLDSFQTIFLVTELERAFSISIPGDLIVPENFASVAALQSLIAHSKTGST